MYDPRFADHFQNPRNAGELPPPAIVIAVSNPACGDCLKLYVLFDGDTLVDVRYQVRGCAASIAAGSALTELMTAKNAAQLEAITEHAIEMQLGGLAAESKHAAVLCRHALTAALREQAKRRASSPSHPHDPEARGRDLR
jgi:nitrogen fixation protein NifU and related proteins